MNRFSSFKELIKHVEMKARKRVKELADRYRKLCREKPYDKVILSLLREVDMPLSVETISFLTGMAKLHCCEILKKLEKQKLVREVDVSCYQVAHS